MLFTAYITIVNKETGKSNDYEENIKSCSTYEAKKDIEKKLTKINRFNKKEKHILCSIDMDYKKNGILPPTTNKKRDEDGEK